MNSVKTFLIRRIQRWMLTANSQTLDIINWNFQCVQKEIERLNELIRLQSLTAEVNLQAVLYDRWIRTPDILLDRREFGYWLNFLDLFGQGVEVGVRQGDYSRILLGSWKGRLLHSVDAWRSFDQNIYISTCNVSDAEHEKNFQITKERLQASGGRSNVIRATSRDASLSFEDASLDFVYLDAQHHYGAVVEDISLWFPKVKPGGIIGGHDYLDGMIDNSEFGVKSAVDDFIKKNGLRLLVTNEPYPSWFVKK
jgi:hypothetical protein